VRDPDLKLAGALIVALVLVALATTNPENRFVWPPATFDPIPWACVVAIVAIVAALVWSRREK
jgi:hypothetical protein